ncbi:MAG: DUF3501 family protein [Candidatus Paracaedibacteraceae bacterium]|nr:DUF3501 family protein [Candidatus Paracaedibacteraceae bacterium]
MKRTLNVEDIISNDTFCQNRNHHLQDLIQIKKNRRITVGPDVTFYFENHLTLWWQIQEMLRVEKGGEEQLQDELLAYAPLLPKKFNDNSMELVATLMIEIDDIERRLRMLSNLGGIEEQIQLHVGTHCIQATAENDIERTDENGKTSAVHFIRFKLASNQVTEFHQANQHIIFEITHPHYSHKTLLNELQRQALAKDLI